MKRNEAETRRITELWYACQEAHTVYFEARQEAIAEAIKPLEHLRIASNEAIAAYKKASIGIRRWPTPKTWEGPYPTDPPQD